MPLYGFKCDKCGFTEDKLLKTDVSDRPAVCPKCSGNMFKQFSAPAKFDFRGIEFSASASKFKN